MRTLYSIISDIAVAFWQNKEFLKESSWRWGMLRQLFRDQSPLLNISSNKWLFILISSEAYLSKYK